MKLLTLVVLIGVFSLAFKQIDRAITEAPYLRWLFFMGFGFLFFFLTSVMFESIREYTSWFWKAIGAFISLVIVYFQIIYFISWWSHGVWLALLFFIITLRKYRLKQRQKAN
ncbi:MAG: hypothetical protein PHR43_04935 [Dehalococcoidales bacterium]|nr:hypothetical protein [Dehalococcoidales bacterium]